MTKRLMIALALIVVSVSGCNLIYKQNIQQGNALEQEDLDQLRLGMSMNQVAFLMGTPSIRDPFHQDRWDYVSSFSRRGGEPIMRMVSLRFEDGALVEMIGVDSDLPVDEEPADSASEPSVAGSGQATGPVAVAEEQAAGQPADSTEPAVAATPQAGATASAAVVTSGAQTPAAPDVEAPAASQLATPAPAPPVTPEPAMPVAAEAAPVPAEPMAPDAGSWTIQMGAFELRENAEELLARLEAAGLEAAIVSLELPDIGPRHLVRQGGLASRADAEATLAEIESALGIVGFIVPASWPQPQ